MIGNALEQHGHARGARLGGDGEQLFGVLVAQLAGKRRQVSRVQHVLFGDALRHAHPCATRRPTRRSLLARGGGKRLAHSDTDV
jgi:hypothetical protein